MKNRVLLVFPPVWMPEAPFLSTAILSAYLKERGIDVVQRDLNVEFWLHFEDEAQIRQIYRRSQEQWRELAERGPQGPQERSLLTRLALIRLLAEDRFVFEVQQGIITRKVYRSLVQAVSDFRFDRLHAEHLGNCAPEEFQKYHDLLYSDISYSVFASSTEDLQAVVDDEANPFRDYFERTFAPDFRRLAADVVGLSIAAINQVVPAFTLAEKVKRWAPRTHVVIGGSWCTQVNARLATKLSFFPYIDSMVIYEGEKPLYEICLALERGEEPDPEVVPNLWRANSVHPPRHRLTMNMNQLPAPDFDGLPLDGYDFSRTLTLQASRGCYWGKCTFCSYPLLEPDYKARKSQKLLDDIQHLQERYGVEDIGFTDALLSPSFCRRFSEALLSSRVRVRWTMFARFEKRFTPDLLAQMAASGCSLVSWGLESGNEEILATIEKSISLPHAEDALAAAAAHGIHNRVLVMYGHPTETFSQILETVDFLRRNFAHIGSISYNYFHPEMGTPIESLAARLGIRLERDDERNLAFGYRWESRLSEEEKLQAKHLFEEISRQLANRSNSTGPRSRLVLSPRELFTSENSFSVALLGEDGGTTLLSTIVERAGGKRRESFVVREF
jgi:anaerobic magnesium-protoporphyrin IX monomethyl ester cyclase